MSCVLGTLFILNSNYVNQKRAEEKLNKEKNSLFNSIMSKRLLQEIISPDNDDVEPEKSKEICDRGSKELKAYYKSGDLSKIGLKNNNIDCEDKNEDYMKNLIDMVREVTGDDENLEPMEGQKIFGINSNRLIKYCLRYLPFLIFFVIAILSIIGWMVCCCCACCDCCCCCCCCKKDGCKVPCFIFTYLFYALAIAACIYGLSQSNKMFEGLADTECSVLKLMEQVTNGESKVTTPKWIGIKGINDLLTDLSTNIDNLKGTTISHLENQKNLIKAKKKEFNDEVKLFDKNCSSNGQYLNDYTKTFSDLSDPKYNNKYVLDLIKMVGHRDNDNSDYPNLSFLYILNLEYSEIAGRTDGYIETSETSFNNILKDKTDDIKKALDKAKNTLNKLKKPFDKYYDQISDILVDYSGDIDYYGKLGVKLALSILMLINVALAVLLLFICCCSLKACTSCCCFRCLFKFCTHIFWNVLALMMVITLLIGSLFSIVGKVGNDGMSLVSYAVSEENLNNDRDPFLIGQAEDVKKYLKICLHGNGSLESEFDLGDSLQRIEDIDDVLNGLDNVTQEFNRIINNLPAFKTLEEQIKNRTEYRTDKFGLAGVTDPNSRIPFNVALELLNNEISSKSTKKESWGINGDTSKKCIDGTDSFSEGEFTLHPKECRPLNRDWVSSSNPNIKDYATIVSSIVDLVKQLETGTFKGKISTLEDKYKSYLNSYKTMISFLNTTINSLIGEIKELAGDGKIFSFVNGKFIGTNFKIILKYLKDSLGGDFYNVGICLILIGFSLLLSVSSTILLLSIINNGLKKNIENENNPRAIREKDFSSSEERKLRNLK